MSIPQQAPLASPERNRVSVASHSDFIESARSREAALTRLIMAYITSGLVFMLLPGTFFGVWNLLQISGRESVASVSPAWLQAHGHAQVFGWIGSFIFGIGFYSIPKLRGPAKSAFDSAWACWVMWSAGVALRWATNVYGWQWRVLLPVSGVLELAAFIIFFRAVSQHRPQPAGNGRLDSWIWVVISASLGFLLVLIANLAGTVYLSLRGSSPALPHKLNQRYLVLMAWGFLVPFIWGFSAKWMRVFLGLRPLRPKILFSAVLFNLTGVALAIAGNFQMATWFLVVGAGVSIVAMRIFETSEQEAKIRGIHWSFPYFVRMAYFWLLVAAMLGVAASIWDTSGGIWGASRHALTVGFVATMVLSVGQRILPAFAGMRLLWSPRLMFVGLVLLTVGCSLRVSCEVLAYQGYASWAWPVLPLSALVELTALSVFTTNILGTFMLQPSHAVKEPMLVSVPELVADSNSR
ncbi:MAG: hypothetical protein WBR10_18695 [Candidatus Acidiferrum sp.]